MLFFIFLQILSMLLYPGGTFFNQNHIGYSFTRNFLSDLGRLSTFSLENNFLSSQIFNMSLILVGIVFSAFYFHLQKLFVLYKYVPIALIGSIFGILGGIFLIIVGLTPADLYFPLHVLSAKWLFRAFFVSSLCYSFVIYHSDFIENKFSVGYVSFALSILLYILISELGPSPRESELALTIQVVSQKIILFIMFFAVHLQTKSLERLNI